MSADGAYMETESVIGRGVSGRGDCLERVSVRKWGRSILLSRSGTVCGGAVNHNVDRRIFG